jgi:hypothetical protein
MLSDLFKAELTNLPVLALWASEVVVVNKKHMTINIELNSPRSSLLLGFALLFIL